MTDKQTWHVEEHDVGSRLDLYLSTQLPSFSRTKIQRLINGQAVLVNDSPSKVSYALRPRDVVTCELAEGERRVQVIDAHVLQPQAAPLDIVYEDEYLIVVNKAAGMVVHAGAGTPAGPTLVQALLAHGANLSSAHLDEGWRAFITAKDQTSLVSADPQGFRPGIVHRLDKDTTGLLVCAKDDVSHAFLADQFQKKTNKREYAALLDGVLPAASVKVESYLFKDPQNRLKYRSLSEEEFAELPEEERDQKRYRHAVSTFYTRKTYLDRLSLVRVVLSTGRTHQIRVHASAMSCGVVGDSLYHPRTLLPKGFPTDIRAALEAVPRQLLHAQTLGFTHPKSKEMMEFHAALPPDFQAVLALLDQI